MSHLRFNAREVLDIAVRIERNGAAFYRKAAAAAAESDRGFLLDLAAMEDDHQSTFAAMRDRLSADEAAAFAPPDEETGLYLEALADYHGGEGSRPAAERLSGRETAAEIVRIAIELELQSIIYYDALRQLTTAELGGARVDAVIAEERRHVGILRRELRRIERDGN